MRRRETNKSTRSRIAAIVLGGCLSLVGCTQTAPWAGEGAPGGDCFPDRTCDPGLVCMGDRCIDEKTADGGHDMPALDTQTSDLPPACQTRPPPTLEPPPQQTPHDRVVIRGAAASDMVEVEVQQGKETFKSKVVGGAFCVEAKVPDLPQPVTFRVVTVDGDGCRSRAATVSTQRVRVEPENVLAGLWPAYTHSKGPIAPLTDGKTNQAVTFSFWDPEQPPGGECNNYALVRFELKALYALDKVIVRYPKTPNFKGFMRCWRLLGATSVTPPTSQGWTQLAQAKKGDKKDLKIELNNVETRHLALLMYEDGGSGWYETFQITEIEAWTPASPPPFVGCE